MIDLFLIHVNNFLMIQGKEEAFISIHQDIYMKCLCHIITQAGARNRTQKDDTADEIESCLVVNKYDIYT